MSFSKERKIRRPRGPDEELPLEVHLEELAFRVKRAILVFIIVFVIITFVPISLEYSYVPLVAEASKALVSYVLPKTVSWMGKTYNVTVIYTGAFEGFSVLLYTSLLFTLIIASPYIGYQIYAYLEPALYPHEKRFLKNGIYSGVGLFVLGVALGYFVLAPITLRIMLMLQAVPLPSDSAIVGLTMNNLLSFIVKLSITTGIAFLFPLAIYYIIVFRIVDASKFEGFNARLTFVIILIVAAFITPDPSGLTMLILAIPYFILFMVGVKMAKRTLRKKEREKARQPS